ncbi:hypothetical protein RDABS01_010068 [Bienertia sinuspersici]
MEGFLRRIWKKFDVDKVVTIKKGMFLIWFGSIEERDHVLSMECPFFDSKPMIIKPWTEDMDLTKEDVKTVPIWIQLSVDFRYWGMNCLEKILKPVGKLLNVDNTTAKRKRLSYARCRVEVSLDQEFPNMVTFNNVKYELTRRYIKYEWKPTVCKLCKKLGHLEEECYHKKSDPKPQQRQQQQWVAKQVAGVQIEEDQNENSEPIAQVGDVEGSKTRADDEEEERSAIKDYQQKHNIYMQFLKQKAKCSWIREGDENTAMFHRSIKKRRLQNNIYVIRDMKGALLDKPNEVAEALLQFYQELLGSETSQREVVMPEIINRGPVLNEGQRESLIAPFTKDEIKKAMFSIHGDKTPGPDGFGSYFFRDNWEIVGDEKYEAVSSFFDSGKLLKEVNSTFLSLIPKVTCPYDVSEFRLIACCNTIYKCITKLICVRLKEVLPELIAENQGAFVHGRYIVHNIMVCQDLVRKYGRKNTTPSCMIKLDLRKAYDTVE